MEFKAKKDTLYGAIFYLCFLLFVINFVRGISAHDWVSILLMPVLFVLFAWIYFGSKYVLSDGGLRLLLGPFTRPIDVAKIQRVRRTKSILASFALSRERLELTYEYGETIHISPADEDRFMTELKRMNPNVNLER